MTNLIPAAPPQPSPAPSSSAAGSSATAPNVAVNAAVLMYHHIAYPPPNLPPISAQYFVPPDRFDQQMFFLLAHGYNFVSLDQIVSALSGGPPLPAKAVAITIDDGWQDFWNNGLHVLEKYSLPATIFAIADDETHGYMNPAERWAIAHSGITVGAHTLTHPHLTKLLTGIANREVSLSKSALQRELQLSVNYFAYPYGDYSPAIEAMVRNAGFKAAFAATVFTNSDTHDLFQLPRVLVSYYDTMQTFADKASDYRWLRLHTVPLPSAVATVQPSPSATVSADSPAWGPGVADLSAPANADAPAWGPNLGSLLDANQPDDSSTPNGTLSPSPTMDTSTAY